MKHLKHHWSARPLSALLSLLLALPVLALFLLGPAPARAQALGRTLPTWAVLDFANPSGYGSTDVGRLAADSFVVELAKLNRYSVLPRQEVLNGISNNNLTPPLNQTSVQKLGQSLGVSGIVAGQIASVSFSSDRRQAKVSLVVRVIDPRSGYLLNGALAVGSSNIRPIPVSDEESLVNEAFGNAAFQAVRQISKFNLPVATVLIGRGVSSVTLNKGSRDGLYNGLSMLITRNGVVTGTVRVSDVTNNDAEALVTDQGQGIRPEDRATAIYELPNYSIDRSVGSFRTASSADVSSDRPSPGTRRNAFSGIGGLLVAILAGGLLFAAINTGHKDHTLGGASVAGPHAVAGRASQIGGTANSTIPAGITAIASVYIPVAVRITSDIGNINQSNFLEYHVYRSDNPAILSSPATLGITPSQGGNGNNNNNNNNNNGGNTSTFSFGRVPLLTQTGSANLSVNDDPIGVFAVNASKPLLTDNSQLISVSASTTVPVATTTGVVTQGLPIPGTALSFGQRVFYQVEGLYLQPSTFGTGSINPGTSNNGGGNSNNNNNGGNNNNNGNNNNGNNNGNNNNNNNNGGLQNNNNNNNNNSGTTFGHGQTYQLTGLRNTNTVTLIEPVFPRANAATGTGLNNVNFTIPTTRGGNQYVLEISTDPGFGNGTRRFGPQSSPGVAPATNPNNFGTGTISVQTGTAVVFNNINLTADFPNGSVFFFRVGARDASNGDSEGDNPYVFNDPLPVNLNALGAAVLQSHAQAQQRHRGRF